MQSEFPADLLAGDPSVERPELYQRRSRPFTRFVITFCLGVAATLAWQSYGDGARQMIADASPQLGWLAPQPAAAQAAADAIAPATPSADPQELKAMSLGLAAVHQRVDQLAAQVAASQDQLTRDITARLQATEQDILNKISAPPPPRPDAAPVRKPVPPPQVVPPR
jgi:hypothetical protein